MSDYLSVYRIYFYFNYIVLHLVIKQNIIVYSKLFDKVYRHTIVYHVTKSVYPVTRSVSPVTNARYGTQCPINCQYAYFFT